MNLSLNTTRHLAKTIALAGAVAALAVPVAQAGSPAVDLKSLDPAIRTALVAKQARVVHADDRAGLRGVSPSFDATLDPAIRTAIAAKQARVVHADDRAGLRGVSPSFDATLDPAIRTAIVAKRRGF